MPSSLVLSGFDHIVLCVRDVPSTIAFYQKTLGMEAREERPGKWSLHFGDHKVSLQDAASAPSIAKDTLPGSGNFCIHSETPVAAWRTHLEREGVTIVDSGIRAGAIGEIDSLYFHDPDRNLVEICNRL